MLSSEFLTLREAMDRLLQDSFVRNQGNPTAQDGRFFVPPANAWESQDEVVLELALPGVNPDNVDITFEQDTLTISGHFQQPQRSNGQNGQNGHNGQNGQSGRNWILFELPRGQFHRRFNLQVPLDADRVEATYNNGILTLHLPKSEAVKPRKIQVRTAQSQITENAP
jgi:HSP20 family protein